MLKRALLTSAALAIASPAGATLQIAATVGGDTFFCADQAACDTNSAIGILDTGPTAIGGITFTGSEQTQTIGTTNTLTTTSLSITNTTGATVPYQFAVGGTNFQGPVAAYSASGSGTWLNAQGSTIDMAWTADNGNGQGADTSSDLPGTALTNSGVITAGPGTDAYSFTHNGAFADNDLFSMTMGASGSIISGGTVRLIGRSQDITAESVPVGEPGTLALLGAALAGFGILVRRRQIEG